MCVCVCICTDIYNQIWKLDFLHSSKFKFVDLNLNKSSLIKIEEQKIIVGLGRCNNKLMGSISNIDSPIWNKIITLKNEGLDELIYLKKKNK